MKVKIMYEQGQQDVQLTDQMFQIKAEKQEACDQLVKTQDELTLVKE